MVADAQWPLQQAVYSALRAASGLTDLLANGADSVLDHAPQELAPYPYVVLGETTAVDWSAKTFEGQEHTLTLHTWSRYRGQREGKLIMAAVAGALDQAALSVTGHRLVLIRFEFSDTFMDPDGITRHGVQRFRALTEEA